ncbi:MAG: hypothetical protein MZV63_45745 [Marinilabiliales bacterium]|nr:hypothetical protein [Marinilabiliales bacterium]
MFEYNPRAIRSYEKAGFRHEGRMRGALNKEGKALGYPRDGHPARGMDGTKWLQNYKPRPRFSTRASACVPHNGRTWTLWQDSSSTFARTTAMQLWRSRRRNWRVFGEAPASSLKRTPSLWKPPTGGSWGTRNLKTIMGTQFWAATATSTRFPWDAASAQPSMRALETRARKEMELADPDLRVFIRNGMAIGDTVSREMHEAEGYKAIRFSWRMEITLEGAPRAEVPAGSRTASVQHGAGPGGV